MNHLKLIISSLFVLVFLGHMSGQNHTVFDRVQELKDEGDSFVLLHGVLQTAEKSEAILTDFIDESEIQFISYQYSPKEFNKQSISMKVPMNGQQYILDLIAVPDSFYDYGVRYNNASTTEAGNTLGHHFRGVVKGDKHSLVALSFFEDYVSGFIANDQGTFYLSKMTDNSGHIIYQKGNLKKQDEFQCSVEDSNFTEYDPEILLETGPISRSSSSEKTVQLYFETESDIFNSLNQNTKNVETYVMGLFNQVATIYQNEGITTEISEIHIWTFPDPYTASNTADLLDQFQAERTSFNGDLGQLLTFRSAGGGRAAGFDGLCNTFPVFSLAVSTGLSSNIPVFPDYSLSVEFVTHEFGHLFGSNHTHDCVWNGNNTAIDSCAGGTTGNCPIPGLPAKGGTIMSYCYLTPVGIDFKLGFGPQPGNVIRNSVANASCLDTGCPEDIEISENVSSGETDIQEASNSILATNTIFPGGTAQYDSGAILYLKPGFRALSGSNFSAFIEGCSQTGTRYFVSKKPSSEESAITKAGRSASKTTLPDIKIVVSPMPIKNEATIKFMNRETHQNVHLDLYSGLGSKVRSLFQTDILEPGTHRYTFRGDEIGSGIFILVLSTDQGRQFKKVVIQ